MKSVFTRQQFYSVYMSVNNLSNYLCSVGEYSKQLKFSHILDKVDICLDKLDTGEITEQEALFVVHLEKIITDNYKDIDNLDQIYMKIIDKIFESLD